MQGFSNRSIYFQEILVQTRRLIFSLDGWPLFSKQKPIHWQEGVVNNTLVFWCFGCHCCGYACCISVSIALKWYDCVSTHQVTLQVWTLQVLWPGSNSYCWLGESCRPVTQDNLVFLRVFRDPVKWSDTDPKSLVQTRPAGGTEGPSAGGCSTCFSWHLPLQWLPPVTTQSHSHPPSPPVSPSEAHF